MANYKLHNASNQPLTVSDLGVTKKEYDDAICASLTCGQIVGWVLCGTELVRAHIVPHDIESLIEYRLSLGAARDGMSEARLDSIRHAIELGASNETLETLAGATRLSRDATIVLPPHRFEGMSRGKGWARKGSGKSVSWGERRIVGYRVDPGRWTIGGNDGFSRKEQTVWDVQHVRVGDETWTVAS
jgi:hypothetical protein